MLVNELRRADKVWLEGVIKEVGAKGLEVDVIIPTGFTVNYDPKTFTAHQAQEMVAITERDGRFEDYGVSVENNQIYFTY